ncbi:nuclear transport factor 2 family protein [Actinomadura madurae]|uniref:nuclear transport factor 2 family protein n=1 Tax=Actinomadura madurae TaxID=1993 RepID=UPI0039995647
MTSRFPTFLDELEARTRIHDTLLRFCRGIDRKDWRLLLSAFHEDAVDDHGWVAGNPRRDLVPGLQARHETVEHSAHVLTNVAYTFLSSTDARVESYVTVAQRERPGSAGQVRRTQALVRYVDLFQRRDDGAWLIADRTLVYGDMIVAADGSPFDPPAAFTVQRRDGNDPLEQQNAS